MKVWIPVFDGDSLSFIPVKDSRLIKTFEQTLSPVFNYISRTNGKCSAKMNYVKDYAIILAELYSLNETDVEDDE